MDAHLVGYGSSSEDEGKAKKRDVQTKPPGKGRNFRKRSMTPEKSSAEESIKQTSKTQDFESSTDILEQTETEKSNKSKTNESPSEERRYVSKSQSPVAERSPDRKKNHDGVKKSRSRSRSLSSSSDKEQRSAVDQYGRHVRRQHSGRTKDEDRSSKDKRRYSREQKRSRSRSRSRERDRGFERRDSYRRRNDDRYKSRGGGRRWSRDGKRERSLDRSRERSQERDLNRSGERSRSRDHSPKRRERRGGGQVYLGGLERKPVVPAKEKVLMSSEEIEKKLTARAESLKQEAQTTATNLNLPSYLNPSVVNPQLYAKQQEKRKLLWSGKKTEEVPSNSNMWAGSRFTGDQDGEVKAKFRRLMGIKNADGSVEPTEGDVTSKGEKILTDLEEEFERSRAFQLSRGAGGKSGIGLGYASANYNG